MRLLIAILFVFAVSIGLFTAAIWLVQEGYIMQGEVVKAPAAEPSAPQPQPSREKNWHEGGSLHGATVSERRQGTQANRLATSADFVVKGLPAERGPASLAALRVEAEWMRSCIDAAVKDVERVANQPVTEIAAGCLVTRNED